VNKIIFLYENFLFCFVLKKANNKKKKPQAALATTNNKKNSCRDN